MLKKTMLLALCATLLVAPLPVRADGPILLGLGTLTSMALSPDGTRLAVGTTIGVYFYDAQNFAPISSWETGYVVERLLWSPRGDVLAVASNAAQQMELRAVNGGAVQWSRAIARCRVECRYRWVFSPDGTWLLVAVGKAIEARDVATGAVVQSLSSGSALDYHSLAIGPQGQLAACCADRQTQIWDVAAGRVTTAIYAAEGDELAWGPDGKFLSVGGRLWDLATKLRRGWGYTNDWIGTLVFSPDGRRVAASDGYGAVRVWTLHDDTLRRVLIGHKAFITDLAWAADGNTLYSAGDNAVRVWDVNAGKQIRLLNGFSPASRHVAWSADGRQIISHENEQIVVADVDSRMPTAVAPLPYTESCWQYDNNQQCYRYAHKGERVLGSPAGDLIAVATNAEVTLYDAAPLRLARHLPTHYPVFQLAFSPDGKYLATGGDSPYVVIWDAATGIPNRSLLASPLKAFIVALAFSPDGQTLYSLDGDGKLWNWSLLTQTHMSGTFHNLQLCWFNYPARQTEDFHDGCGYQVGAAIISPAAGRVAIQHDNGIVISDMTTGRALYSLDAPGLQALAVNPQGTRLAAGVGNAVMIWKLDTGELVAEYYAHTGKVNDVAFSPNGHSLASGGRDGTVRIWDVP